MWLFRDTSHSDRADAWAGVRWALGNTWLPVWTHGAVHAMHNTCAMRRAQRRLARKSAHSTAPGLLAPAIHDKTPVSFSESKEKLSSVLMHNTFSSVVVSSNRS